jgi:hypothetical protein
MSPKLVSAQRPRCDRGGKARNIREKCQGRKQKGAATGKIEFLAVEAVWVEPVYQGTGNFLHFSVQNRPRKG